jgi:acyl carrier protein
MTNTNDLLEAVYRALDQVNAQLPEEARVDKRMESALFGREEGLDSLSLVNLIVAVEREVEAVVGRPLTLSWPDAWISSGNPFATVRSMVDYIESMFAGD